MDNMLNFFWYEKGDRKYIVNKENLFIDGFIYLIFNNDIVFIGNLKNSKAIDFGVLFCQQGLLLSGWFSNGLPFRYKKHKALKHGFNRSNINIKDSFEFNPHEVEIPESFTIPYFERVLKNLNKESWYNELLDEDYIENWENENFTNGFSKLFPIIHYGNPNHEKFKINKTFNEGILIEKAISIFERDPTLRKMAILKHGTKCFICGFSFNSFYSNQIANSFIEIHHLNELKNGERLTDPEKDLIPLCSNCHRMIHKFENPNMESVVYLKSIIIPLTIDNLPSVSI